jgi:uncharacterized protein YndB with AHSA1/START domain
MIKIISLVAVALIAAILVFASTKPDTFAVTRSATINASPDKVFGLITDLKAFNTWNAWVRKEPSVMLSYSGAVSGVGAAYTWVGEKSGQGRMEITDITSPTKAVMKLDFVKPFASTNRTEFTLAAQGEQTQVTWNMSGPMPFISKLMSVFVSMDKMIGPDFEAGLANLKIAAEAR